MLNNIKDWFDVRIEANDLSDDVGQAKLSTSVNTDDFNEGSYIFSVTLFIKDTVDKEKYVDIIKDRFATADKTTFTHAHVDKYDNCSHDSNNPQPCTLTRVLEWNA